MAASPASTRLPVLVIEDEAPVMAFLCSALERSGYKTVQANSGAEGIKLLEQGSFMGIISDMRTPGGMNGADVHAWIKKNRPAMSRRMLFITGDTVNPETTDILKKTGVPYIEKPFRISHLIAALERVLGRSV